GIRDKLVAGVQTCALPISAGQLTRPFSLKRPLCCWFALTVLACLLTVASSGWAANAFNSVYISEFLANDQHTLQDEQGDFSGWKIGRASCRERGGAACRCV